MEKLLFTRRYNGGTYEFYSDTLAGNIYYKVLTPCNAFGYHDIILFTEGGTPYTVYRYLQPWILKACKNALIKRGYMNR